MGNIFGGGRGTGTPTNPGGSIPDNGIGASLPGSYGGTGIQDPNQPKAPGPVPQQIEAAAIANQQQSIPAIKAPVAAAAGPDTETGSSTTRDTARRRQEDLGFGASYRRATLLSGLLGLSDSNAPSARKSLLGL